MRTKLVFVAAAMVYVVSPVFAHDALPAARQSVMIGPFGDGRVVWCKGHQDESGNLVISPEDAGTCRMDTSDVKVAAPLNCPAPELRGRKP